MSNSDQLSPAAPSTATQPSRLAGSQLWPLLGLLLSIALTVWRNPRFFLQPRLWAEEGAIHFAFSFSHPWYQALFQPQLGMLNLWPNLSTVLATRVPLESAPLVTTLMAFLAQLLPVGLILWSKSPLWSGWLKKLAGIAILTFVPLTREVWLNSVNSYVYLVVLIFLILLEEPPLGRARRWVYRLLLGLGGLSSASVGFLLPVFFYRALTEKQRERWLQTGVLGFFTAIQAGIIFLFRSTWSVGERFHLIGLNTLGVTVWTQTVGLFSLGLDNIAARASELYKLAGQQPAAFQVEGRLVLLGMGILCALLLVNLPGRLLVVFGASYLILMVVTMTFTGVTDKYYLFLTGLGERLFLAPNVIFGWMLLFGLRVEKVRGWRRTGQILLSGLSGVILCAALLWGMSQYWQPWATNEPWQDWKSEVRLWRADPTYAPKILPKGWTVNLKK